MTTKQSASLLALLLALPACGDLTDVPAYVLDVAYRPDGELVVFTTGGIKVYEGDLSSEKVSIPVDARSIYPVGGFDLSSNGEIAAITEYAPRPKSILYRIQDGSPLGSFQPTMDQRQIDLSPNGDKVYAFGSLETESLYNLADGSLLWSLSFGQMAQGFEYCKAFSYPSPSPAYSSDGTTMYVPFFERLVAVDMATGSAHEIARVNACIGAVVALPDGSLLVHRGFSRTFNDSIAPPNDAAQENSFAIYTTDGTLVREIPAFAGYETEATIWGSASQVACAPVGNLCAMFGQPFPIPSADGSVGVTHALLLWSLDGALLWSANVPNVEGISFSPDSSRVAVGSNRGDGGAGSARIYRVADGALLAERSYTKGVF
jgi:hypothetical protein